MNSKLLNCLVAGALATTLALASPAIAFHGGGGMHGGGKGGGMHFGAMSGGMHVGGMSGGPHFSGSRFAGAPFAHAAFSPRFSSFAFRDRRIFFHHRFHHRFHRFAIIGAPFAYAAYDSCWRRVWTPYGPRWIDVCNDYGY